MRSKQLYHPCHGGLDVPSGPFALPLSTCNFVSSSSWALANEEAPIRLDSKPLGESLRVEIAAPNPKPELQTRFWHPTSHAHSGDRPLRRLMVGVQSFTNRLAKSPILSIAASKVSGVRNRVG